MLLEELHHLRVVASKRFVHRRTGGVNVGVGIRPALEEDGGHHGVPGSGTLAQRAAPSSTDLLETAYSFVLIRIEAGVQQQAKYFRPIRCHGQADKARIISQRAFRVMCPQPVGIARRDRSPNRLNQL